MTNRRSFLATASAAAAALALRPVDGILAAQPLSQPGADPLRNLIVINSLGGLDNGYGPRPSALISDAAIADAKASGLTATNFTLSSGDDFEGAIAAIARRDDFIRSHANDLAKVFTTDDIRRAKADRKIGIIYGFQNAAMLGDKAERVDIFADLGVRCIQLTYNVLNRLGGGSLVPGNEGLTPFGREVVARLNAKKVMVDLSHSGRQICLDAARASARPISINHTGCAALQPHPRNKTDEELKLVADRGGYVGIYFMMYLTKDREATIDDVVRHIDHAVNLCGEDHVGIGTDHGVIRLTDMAAIRTFYADQIRGRARQGIGAPGEVPDILPFAQGLTGPDQFRNLYRALERKRYSATRIEKILGRNYMTFAREIWGA